MSSAALVGAPPQQAGRGGRGGGEGGLTRGPDDQQIVDPAAANRGRSTYIAECITCHGPKARGGDQGADLVRSQIVIHDRNGVELAQFLKKGHPMQSGKPSASLATAQIVDLANFLRERLTDTLSRTPGNSGNPAPNILTGNAKAGEAFFNGVGKCSTCHNPTGDLKGFAARNDPVTIQQRFLFPGPVFGRGGRGGAAAPSRVTITVTPPNGPAVTGLPDRLDDFNVTLRDSSGAYHSWARTPDLKVEKHDPLAAHHALLAILTDKDMHDVVAYLETLK
jgi:mono/diheme cytochrome c family protein